MRTGPHRLEFLVLATANRAFTVPSREGHMQQRVKVWGDTVIIEVEQRSKSVWIAYGEYLGHRFETKDRSAGSAAKRWAEAAKYRTN